MLKFEVKTLKMHSFYQSFKVSYYKKRWSVIAPREPIPQNLWGNATWTMFIQSSVGAMSMGGDGGDQLAESILCVASGSNDQSAEWICLSPKMVKQFLATLSVNSGIGLLIWTNLWRREDRPNIRKRVWKPLLSTWYTVTHLWPA